MKRFILVILFFLFPFISFAQNLSDVNKSKSESNYILQKIQEEEKNIKLSQNNNTERLEIISIASGNWSDASIWSSNTVPTLNDDVIIRHNVLEDVKYTTYCKNLTIDPSVTLTVTSSYTLSVKGNFLNNGTYTLNSAASTFVYGDFTNNGTFSAYNSMNILYFIGSSNQTVLNTGTIVNQIYNFVSTNSSIVTISPLSTSIPVYQLSLTKGSLINGDKMLLGKNASATIFRNGSTPGNIDTYPTLNIGTNGQLSIYYLASTSFGTGYEIPETYPVSIFVVDKTNNINLNRDVTINQYLHLTKGNLNINSKTLTLNNVNILIESGTATGGGLSSVKVNGSAQTILPTIINGLYNLEINNSGGLSLTGNNTILNSVIFTSGNITTNTYSLTFETSSLNPVEKNSSKIIGTSIMSPRQINTGGIYFLNANIDAGDDCDNLSITRYTGTSGIVTVNGKSGIKCKWEISSTAAIPPSRNISFEWLSSFDNGHLFGPSNPAWVFMSADAGNNWCSCGLKCNPIQAGELRSISINNAIQSLWTITSEDSPLPVTLESFFHKINKNNVTLVWKTSSESNNFGFEVYRNDTYIGFIKGNNNSSIPIEYTFKDDNLKSGTYKYKLKQIDNNGNYIFYDKKDLVNIDLPGNFSLLQNYPNPFNPETNIDFTLPITTNIKLELYDVTGKRVKNIYTGNLSAGYHSIKLNASNLSAGIYFYNLKADNFSSIKKLMIIK